MQATKLQTAHKETDANIFACPSLWPAWPLLPVHRETAAKTEVGVMIDLFHDDDVRRKHTTGYRSTVFLTNAMRLMERGEITVGELVRIPKEIYDLPEEIAAAGWKAD